MKLDGKVALITGAASGIGHAIARRYVEAGGKVVIADLNADGAAKAANELGDTKTAIGIAMDVSKEDQVNAGIEQAVNAFGRIDILEKAMMPNVVRIGSLGPTGPYSGSGP